MSLLKIRNKNGEMQDIVVLRGKGGIPVPETAEVGQTIVVKAVDENGKPTEWEAVDLPSGGGSGGVPNDFKLLDTFDLSSGATSYEVDTTGCTEIMAVTISALTCSTAKFIWKDFTNLGGIGKALGAISYLWYVGNGVVTGIVPRGDSDTLVKSVVFADAKETNNKLVTTFGSASAGTVNVYGR